DAGYRTTHHDVVSVHEEVPVSAVTASPGRAPRGCLRGTPERSQSTGISASPACAAAANHSSPNVATAVKTANSQVRTRRCMTISFASKELVRCSAQPACQMANDHGLHSSPVVVGVHR